MAVVETGIFGNVELQLVLCQIVRYAKGKRIFEKPIIIHTKKY